MEKGGQPQWKVCMHGIGKPLLQAQTILIEVAHHVTNAGCLIPDNNHEACIGLGHTYMGICRKIFSTTHCTKDLCP